MTLNDARVILAGLPESARRRVTDAYLIGAVAHRVMASLDGAKPETQARVMANVMAAQTIARHLPVVINPQEN